MANVPRPRVYFKLFTILILIGGCLCFLGIYQVKEISPALERLGKINSDDAVLGVEKISGLIDKAKNGTLRYAKSPLGSAPLELRSQFSQINEQLLFLNAEVLNNLVSLSRQPDPHGLNRVTALLNKTQSIQQTTSRIQAVLLAIEDIAPLPQQQAKVKELSDKISPLFNATAKPLLEISETYQIMIKKEKMSLEARKIVAQKSVLTGAILTLIAFVLLVYRMGYVRAAAKRGHKTPIKKSDKSAQT